MKALRTYLILGALAVAVGGAGYLLWFSGQGGGDDRGRQAVLVTLAPAVERDFVDVIEAVGTARANESIDITAKTTETIGAVNFADGQQVDAGFVIAEMTSREQSADLSAARAELSEAERSFGRISDLSAKGFATKAQLGGAVAARDSAAARVKALESRVTDRLIRAPFAGVLGLRKVSVGTLVKPGDVITTLDDISLIKLDFTVPEAFLSVLKEGMSVRVNVAAYPGRTFEGKVAGIDTRVDPVSRAVAMRAETANPDGLLRPGMLATVSLLKNERKSLAVPEQALVPVEDRQYVFAATADNKAERREVTIGARQPGFVEIISGLKIGDRVVVEGTLRLRPGATITVADEREEPKSGKTDAAGPRT
jgi:membrane fusion protein, multidrug efflux system